MLPTYSPVITKTAITRNDQVIKSYLDLGLAGPETALFLASVHGIGISLRQVKKVLARLARTRRRRRSGLTHKTEAISFAC